MNKTLSIIAVVLLALVSGVAQAASGKVAAIRSVADGYNFWLYAPSEYYEHPDEDFPVIIFLHGQSLCGSDMNRSRKYGVLDAVEKGRHIPALVMCPQNPGGSWKPSKINAILEWVLANTRADSTRVYVLGMSLGGFGTMDFVGTYPEKVAASMALCGGTTLKDFSGLAKAPIWIIHGTADNAVSINASKRVVSGLQAAGPTPLLRFEWIPGASHGDLARYFYTEKTYEWLFQHLLDDDPRQINRTIDINASDRQNAYKGMGWKDTHIETVNTITK
ncbi:MAG: dienelactone hydrolase family protein [Muribaculaceae bacterium]|nr:dienelactone hydrolase family protein [Muribaculaceae bacterium]